jgi:hypothetical protein
MEFLKDRRVLVALGAALALVAGIVIAVALTSGAPGDKSAPPASQGGLVVETGEPDGGGLDPARPLRCFVAGRYVGEITLAECAKRNGVATGALDVGIDESGALAAADQAGTVLTPLPMEEVVQMDPAQAPQAPVAPTAPAAPIAPIAGGGPAGVCMRYAENRWEELPNDMPIGACAQALFAGRCERQGAATYGRWNQQTLRLVAGRVEVSSDNRRFRTLVEQGPNCSIPPIG